MHFDPPALGEHEYYLAVLRGKVLADTELLTASDWLAIIEELRAEGFDIRETDSGYALTTGGLDVDGTGWTSPEFYPEVVVDDDLDLDVAAGLHLRGPAPGLTAGQWQSPEPTADHDLGR